MDLNKGAPVTARPLSIVREQTLSPARGGSLASWLVVPRSPLEIWHDEPTFLLCELEIYVLAILAAIHAYRHGGRYAWLWWTTIFHGLTTELVSYWYEDVDNFWHAQSSLMLFGLRDLFRIYQSKLASFTKIHHKNMF